MFPTSTPFTSINSSKREQQQQQQPISISTPLSQVFPQEFSDVSTRDNVPPSTASRTYKTRERLYYETDYVKAPSSPVNNVPNTANTSSNTLFEPFLRKQQSTTTAEDLGSEELPPTASLHEYLLTGSESQQSPKIQASSINTTNMNVFGSPMVINGVIGSPMKSTRTPNMESSQSSTQWNSVLVSGGPQQLTRSVTIFGFPSNFRNEVLMSFQTHGPIESYDLGEGNNWIHIVYESEWAAQKALARNGSIFESIGGVMIGVIPMQIALERVNAAADSFMSPIKSDGHKIKNINLEKEQSSIFLSDKNKKSSLSNNSVNISNLPSESSLVTKAVNYVFGW